MMRLKNILLFLLTVAAFSSSVAAQQKSDRSYIRSGNKNYNDSIFDQAEIKYRKALEANPRSADAMYNLGNTLIRVVNQKGESMSQEDLEKYAKEVVEQYNTSASIETDKGKLAEIYHNMGDMLYLTQNYAESVEAFKKSLRNNPNDDETRYNLAKALYMLRNQQNQQQRDQQQDQQQDEQQDQQQQDQQQQQQEQEQQQQQQDAQEQPAKKSEDISEENAEQILQALMQDEKDLQEKIQRMQQQQPRKLEKDW